MIHCYHSATEQKLTAMHPSSQQSAPYSSQFYANNFGQQQSDQSHNNQMRSSPASAGGEQHRAAVFSHHHQQQQRRPHESSQTNSNPLACGAPSAAAGHDNQMTKAAANQISPGKRDGQPTLIDTTRHLSPAAGGRRDSPGEFKHTHQEHSTTELYDRLYGGRLVDDEHLEASLQEDWTSHLHGFDFGALHQQVSHTDQYARGHTAARDDDDDDQHQQQHQAYRQHNNYSGQQVAVDDRKPAHDFNNNNNNNNDDEQDATSTLSFAPLMPIVDSNQQQQNQREQQHEPTSNNYYESYQQQQQQSNHGDPYLPRQMSPTSSGKQQTPIAFAAHDTHQVVPRYHYTPAHAPLQPPQQQQHHHNYDESQHQETSFQDYYTYTNFEPTSGDQQQLQQPTQEYHTFDTLTYQQQQPHFRLADCSPTETDTSYSLQQLATTTTTTDQQQSLSDHNHLLLVSSTSSSSSPSASSQSSVSSPAASSGASTTSSAENRPAISRTPTQNQTDGAMKTLMKSLATGGASSPSKVTGITSGASVRSRRGRPRKKGASAKGKVSGKLWEFIRDLLLSERTNPSFIRWERREDGVFKFVQSDKVAKMWGERKQNPKMTYEKLSRAMRYYYKSKVLLPVFGRRLVYKFGPNATGWMPALGAAVSVAQPLPCGGGGGGDPSPVAPSTMTLVYHHHHHHPVHESKGMSAGEQPHTIHYRSAEHLQHQNNHHSHHDHHGQQQLATTTPTMPLHHEEIIY